jgi:hypothetical protein
MSKNTSKNFNANVSVGNAKFIERWRDPVTGHLVKLQQLMGHYRFEIMLCYFIGKRKPKWEVKQAGYIAAKQFLRSKLQSLLDNELSMDTGCDFYPNCLSCPRSQDQCPNQTNWTGKTLRIQERIALSREMRKTKSVKEIAQELGKSVRTIERDLEGMK